MGVSFLVTNKHAAKTSIIIDIAVDGVSNTDAFPRFANTTITGLISNSSCTVESVNPYYDAGFLITELKVSSVTKDFVNGEPLVTTIEIGRAHV